MSKISSTVHYSIKDQIVRVRLNTPDAKAAVAKFGNAFWKRQLSGGGVMLIPVPGGIPRVADFIIVSHEDVIYDQDQIGYGASAIQGASHGK